MGWKKLTGRITLRGVTLRSFPEREEMRPTRRMRPTNARQLVLSSCKARRIAAYRRSNTILVPDFRPNHESNSFFITKRNLETLGYKIQSGVPDIFESWYILSTLRVRVVYQIRYGDRPVRHSTNLNPSALAMDAIIFELTVDATIASFSMGRPVDL